MKLVLLAALAAGPVDPVAKMSELTVTGWSADETRYSVRAFDRDDSDTDVECPGYVDQEGKKFAGSLVVAAYEGTRLLQSWVVQDWPKCTPPAKAKQTLTEAKAKLAELGIKLDAKGTRLDCKKRCVLGGGAAVVVDNQTSTEDDEDGNGAQLSGTLRIRLEQGKASRVLFEKTFKEGYALILGASMSVGLEPLAVAPSGKVFLARAFRFHFTTRGGDSVLFPIGLVNVEKP